MAGEGWVDQPLLALRTAWLFRTKRRNSSSLIDLDFLPYGRKLTALHPQVHRGWLCMHGACLKVAWLYRPENSVTQPTVAHTDRPARIHKTCAVELCTSQTYSSVPTEGCNAD